MEPIIIGPVNKLQRVTYDEKLCRVTPPIYDCSSECLLVGVV